MRVLAAACLCLALTVSGCAPSLQAPAVPTPQRATAPTAVSQPLSHAVHRTPVATPAATPLAVAAPTVAAQPTALAARPLPILDGLLSGILPEGLDGAVFSVLVEDLASGATTSINPDQTLPSASLYKLGVAWAVMRQVDAGTLRLDTPLEITDDDAVEPEPNGGVDVGDTPTVQEALMNML